MGKILVAYCEGSAMKLSFSTSWCDGRIDRLYRIIPLVDAIEAGSKGSADFFEEVERLAVQKKFRVASIHAVSGPSKEQHPADYAPDFASTDERTRKNELDRIERSVEWAMKIGTQAVVIHTGQVDNDGLKNMILSYKKDIFRKSPDKRDEVFDEIVRTRKRLGREHVEPVLAGLDELCRRFPEIQFFIETRIHYYEIPLPDELEEIFQTLPHKNLGYWHDIGHTYIQDRLGFVPMSTWQERFGRRCGGVHIHDVTDDLTDHWPPGEGVLDLQGILKQFNPQRSQFTLEINARSRFESVANGVGNLRENTLTV